MNVEINQVILHDNTRKRWLHFRQPECVVTASRIDEVEARLAFVEEQVLSKGFWAAGFVAYEAAPAFDLALKVLPDGGFPLLWFGLYSQPEVISLPGLGQDGPTDDIDWPASIGNDEYSKAIKWIKSAIERGETYQVNYTYRLHSTVIRDQWGLFLRMIHAQGAAYGAYVETQDWTLCSASPELFFLLNGEHIESRPMKGTAPRGRTLTEDNEHKAALLASKKDRAENLMIVDMVRNDLGRIARTGTVKVSELFSVEKYPTVWQMTSTVVARTQCGLVDIFRGLFPAASITGAPKARTMEIISGLETLPRRIYTGTIGYFAPQRQAQFNVAIRTVAANRHSGKAEYGVGGGIVWDSRTNLEMEECRTKAKVLFERIPQFSLLETLRWEPGQGYWLLDLHLKRLQESAEYFSFSVDLEEVRRRLLAELKSSEGRSHLVRLLVSEDGEIRITSTVLDPARSASPFRVCLSTVPVDSSNPFLYHKTTHRRIYEDALAAHPGFDDVILLNEKGQITESTIANVLVELEGRLFTPPVECGLLKGVYRQSLLINRERIKERLLTPEDLEECSRIYLVNSVRGILPIELETDTGFVREIDTNRRCDYNMG